MTKHLSIGFLILALIFGASTGLTAPNKVFLLPMTPLKFADSAQSGVAATLTLTGLGAGAGQCSVRYDKNALVSPSGAMPYVWRWGGTVTLNGTPSATGDPIEIYAALSDGTIEQGNLGSTGSSISLASARRSDLTFAGAFFVDQTTANPTIMGAGPAEIPTRYFRLCVWNGTALAFTASTSVHTFYMTPYAVEIQAAIPLDYDNRTAVPTLALAA